MSSGNRSTCAGYKIFFHEVDPCMPIYGTELAGARLRKTLCAVLRLKDPLEQMEKQAATDPGGAGTEEATSAAWENRDTSQLRVVQVAKYRHSDQMAGNCERRPFHS
jgi:hypothetical protein